VSPRLAITYALEVVPRWCRWPLLSTPEATPHMRNGRGSGVASLKPGGG
jgi:hypothetical protein